VEGFGTPFVYWIRGGGDVHHHPARVRTCNREISGISERLVSQHSCDSGIFLGDTIQNRRDANRRARNDCLPGCRGNRLRCPSPQKSRRRAGLRNSADCRGHQPFRFSGCIQIIHDCFCLARMASGVSRDLARTRAIWTSGNVMVFQHRAVARGPQLHFPSRSQQALETAR
jgi:hypothetical protein